mmetsp:Transcript_39129/g.110819  ORF Transcript_39129/g.110819 Transcript_39129/m.110819 type:complete len:214 (+) Transcript_39129:167-808(+)
MDFTHVKGEDASQDVTPEPEEALSAGTGMAITSECFLASPRRSARLLKCSTKPTLKVEVKPQQLTPAHVKAEANPPDAKVNMEPAAASRKRDRQAHWDAESTHDALKPQTKHRGKDQKAPTSRPHPKECWYVAEALAAIHGDVSLQRLRNGTLLQEVVDQPEDQRTVLDSLIRAMLSQNTTDILSQRSYSNLKGAFPSWEDVRTADPGLLPCT